MRVRELATDRTVWTAIRAAHPGMVVFETFSDPHGAYNGETRGRLLTVYGFRGATAGTIGAETTWEIDPDRPDARLNESTRYWLCVPYDEACGTCRWWAQYPHTTPAVGACKAPYPASLINESDRAPMRPQDGAGCPCYEAKP